MTLEEPSILESTTTSKRLQLLECRFQKHKDKIS